MCVMLLDQLKNEHAVDIFQRVRALQRQRFAMLTNLVRFLLPSPLGRSKIDFHFGFLGSIRISLRNDFEIFGRIF